MSGPLHIDLSRVTRIDTVGAWMVHRLLRDRPEGLYRAKGFVDFGGGHRYLLQLVGGSLRLQKRRGTGTQLAAIVVPPTSRTSGSVGSAQTAV